MYVPSDTLLLPAVFENFRNMYLKTYEHNAAKFLSAPGLAWQVALKQLGKIRSVNWYKYIINGRKKYYQSIYWYRKANNKYMKDHDEHFFNIRFFYNLYGWAMSQKFPVNNIS